MCQREREKKNTELKKMENVTYNSDIICFLNDSSELQMHKQHQSDILQDLCLIMELYDQNWRLIPA
jgi:hypothetical protein